MTLREWLDTVPDDIVLWSKLSGYTCRHDLVTLADEDEEWSLLLDAEGTPAHESFNMGNETPMRWSRCAICGSLLMLLRHIAWGCPSCGSWEHWEAI